MSAYKPQKGEIASFDLIGYKSLKDDTLRLGQPDTGTIVEDFPDEVEVNGVVYTKSTDLPCRTQRARSNNHIIMWVTYE